MKRASGILVAALLMALVATPGMAQNLSGGVQGGIGFSNLGGDVEGTDSKLGFSAGANLAVDLHEYFRLQFLGQYVRKGAEEQVLGVDVKFNLDYIELLVPATLIIPIENSPIMPRLFVGPAIAFELDCSVSAEGGGVSVDVGCDEFSDVSGDPDDDVETKSIDFGVLFGGGVDVAVGNGAITLDVLYNLGLADINDIPDDPFSVKNQNIQILAGYRFFFGR